MSDFVITSDSTCDLTNEMIKENGIVLKPITIVLGGKEYSDGVDIDAQRVLDFVDNGGDLPKTAAISVEEYKEFFKPLIEGGKKVLHFNISSKASSCHNNAVLAAKELGNVIVVDSKNLTSGQGLLVLKACDLKKEGKSIDEAYQAVLETVDKVQTSFVVDRLDFLHKGGRCSLVALIGAKLLKFHPQIAMNDGQLKVKKKYQGSLKRSLDSYISDLAQEYHNYDKKRCFVTHCMAGENVDFVVAKIKELFDFENVYVSEAGTTVSSHCGKNTLGVLFINN